MPQNDQMRPKIGEIYMMNFGGEGNEQTGFRPGIIIQNNVGNAYSPNVIALPLTTSIKKIFQPTHVMIYADESGLKKDSMVLCENPKCISKYKVGKYVATATASEMEQIAVAFLLATSVISFINPDMIGDLYSRAYQLNNSVPVV